MSITNIISKTVNIIRTRGIAGLMCLAKSRLISYFTQPTESFKTFESMFRGKNGLEVGGPSAVFTSRGIFPVYSIAGNLDNCNFGNITVWEGNIKEGQTFNFDRKKTPGRQFVVESAAMGCITSGTYDFVLASHMLEHTANPFLTLFEWIRLLKEHGILVMLLPHKDGTFDHRRPVTTMEHLVADFNAGMTEDDVTHLPEILALHDLERDPEAGDLEAFRTRSLHNFDNRCFHHHVFDTHLAVSLVDYIGMQILAVETILPMHILVVAQKITSGALPNNLAFTCTEAQCLSASPFSSDKRSK